MKRVFCVALVAAATGMMSGVKAESVSQDIAKLARSAADGETVTAEMFTGVAADWFRENGESVTNVTPGRAMAGYSCAFQTGAVVATKRGEYLYLHVLDPELKVFCLTLPYPILETKYLHTGKPIIYEHGPISGMVVWVERFGYPHDLVMRIKIDLAGGKGGKYAWACRQTEAKEFTDSVGNTLKYRVHEPKDLSPGAKAPLVVLLHGAGERGSNNSSQLFHGAAEILRYAEARHQPLFLLAGQVPSGSHPTDPKGHKWVQVPWDASDYMNPMPAEPSKSMRSLIELVAKYREDPRIDLSRVYVTGVSMGGYGTWDFALRRPEWVAAAMPVCGGVDLNSVNRAKGVKFWIHHGGSDSVVPVARGRNAYAECLKCGIDAKYTEYPGVDHNSWDVVYPDAKVLDWLFSQRK